LTQNQIKQQKQAVKQQYKKKQEVDTVYMKEGGSPDRLVRKI
jgi:hypothetical protein